MAQGHGPSAIAQQLWSKAIALLGHRKYNTRYLIIGEQQAQSTEKHENHESLQKNIQLHEHLRKAQTLLKAV